MRFPENRRQSVEALENVLIDAPGGYRLPLGQLADVAVIEGPVQISRENGQRRIGIEMNVVGRDIGGVVAEAQQRLRRAGDAAAGYYLTWGGQFENQQQAMRRLMIITPAVVGLIFVLLLVTFNSVAPGAAGAHQSAVRDGGRRVRAAGCPACTCRCRPRWASSCCSAWPS